MQPALLEFMRDLLFSYQWERNLKFIDRSTLERIVKLYMERNASIVDLEKLIVDLVEQCILEKTNGGFNITDYQIRERERAIHEFKKLIAQEKVVEREISGFLKDHTWAVDFGYVRMFPERQIGLNGRTDFLAEKSNGNYDIIELKKPLKALFIHTKKYSKMNAPLKDAISQMMSYLSKYDHLRLFQKEESNLDVHYPNGIIIIGRTNDINAKPLRIHNAFLHRIQIKTYDDLLDNAVKYVNDFKRI